MASVTSSSGSADTNNLSDAETSARFKTVRLPQPGDHGNKPTITFARRDIREIIRGLLSFVLALLSVGAATAVFVLCNRWVDVNDAPLFYLPVVIACAIRLGFGPAILTAVTCFLSWDYYFLPPYHDFAIGSQRSWITMIVFAITAITTSSLAARVRSQARAAVEREADMSTLLRASELVSQAVDSDEILFSLVREASASCGSRFTAIFLREEATNSLVMSSQYGDMGSLSPNIDKIVETAATIMTRSGQVCVPVGVDRSMTGMYSPIQHQGIPLGVLFVLTRGNGEQFTKTESRLIGTLAGHAAVTIARSQASEASQARVHQTAVLGERQRLAQEVHDTLSNTFNSIKFMLEAAKRTSVRTTVNECVEVALRLAVDGAQEARRSVWALRPLAFDEGNLVNAIRKMIGSTPTPSEVKVAFAVVGEPRNLTPDVEDNLLRIAQEALTNAVRHGNSAVVSIELGYSDSAVTLTIHDNGVGFDKSTTHVGGFGLDNMRSRATHIGGTLAVESVKGLGTDIRVEVPPSSSQALE